MSKAKIKEADIEKWKDALTQFGLTPNQVKVYVAIRKLGTTAVGPISKYSTVRREDVYRILPKLCDIGLVERILENPAKFKAVPLPTVIPALLKEKREESEKELSILEGIANSLLKEAEPAKIRKEEEHEAVLSFVTERLRAEKAIEMLTRTERELIACSDGKEYVQFFQSRPDYLEYSTPKSIHCNIILRSITEETFPAVNLFWEKIVAAGNSVDIITSAEDHNSCHYLISDRKEALFDISDNGNQKKLLWTDNRKIIDLLITHFEHQKSIMGKKNKVLSPNESKKRLKQSAISEQRLPKN